MVSSPICPSSSDSSGSSSWTGCFYGFSIARSSSAHRLHCCSLWPLISDRAVKSWWLLTRTGRLMMWYRHLWWTCSLCSLIVGLGHRHRNPSLTLAPSCFLLRCSFPIGRRTFTCRQTAPRTCNHCLFGSMAPVCLSPSTASQSRRLNLLPHNHIRGTASAPYWWSSLGMSAQAGGRCLRLYPGGAC